MRIADFNLIEIGDSFFNDVNIYYVVDIDRHNFKLNLFCVARHNLKGLKDQNNPGWMSWPGVIAQMNYNEGIR